MTKEQLQVLHKARDTYGYRNQILVSIEELNELAAVLAKYPRYKRHDTALEALYNKVLSEVADVTIILDHVSKIFDLKPYEIEQEIAGKIERLYNWISKSDSLEQTTIDR